MRLKAALILTGFLAAVQVADAAGVIAAKATSAPSNGDIQQLFDANCVKCHGPLQQKGGLELDALEMALKGGDDGPVIIPGKPDASQLLKNLDPDAEEHMPPKKQLTDSERAMVRQWISGFDLARFEADSKPKTPRAFTSIPEAIDTVISEGWKARKLEPAAEVDDRIWCRRVYLDLAGRICSMSELDAFLKSSDKDKRAALVDKLLASDDYPVHIRELWDVFLIGRSKRDRKEEQGRKNGWWDFLERNFREDRPWNETVHAILTARPDRDDDKGASWFVYERRNDYQAIAEAVAPLVYGTRVACAQCHNHPLARDIKQGHYWGLVAAFNRGKNVDGGTGVSESAIGGFVNFTNLKKESQPAVMSLLNGPTLKEDRPADDAKEEDKDDLYVDSKAKIRVPKYSRRAAFADAVTRNNPLLARAFVNRMWAVLTGRGIVDPPDEMNARNAPSHPELLDWLSQDFEKHNYGVKHLLRGIVLSRVYALGASKNTPPEAFAGALERPLSAEQLARSWRVAAGLPPEDDELRRATIKAMPDVLPREYNANYQQAQFLANSPLIGGLLKSEPGRTVTKVAAFDDDTSRVREAFLNIYERLPDSEEATQAADLLKSETGHKDEAVRDLMWAMMTSAEFLTSP